MSCPSSRSPIVEWDRQSRINRITHMRPSRLSFVKNPSARDWLGLAVPLRVHALLSGVASLARGGPAAFSVGMLAGAIGTTGMAVLFWFASVPLGARRRVLGFVLIWIPSARCVATDDLNIELSAWRALVLDVHTCARSVDTLTSAVGWIASSPRPHRPLVDLR